MKYNILMGFRTFWAWDSVTLFEKLSLGLYIPNIYCFPFFWAFNGSIWGLDILLVTSYYHILSYQNLSLAPDYLLWLNYLL